MATYQPQFPTRFLEMSQAPDNRSIDTAWMDEHVRMSKLGNVAMIGIWLHAPYDVHFLALKPRHLKLPRKDLIIAPPGYENGKPPLSIAECRFWYDRDLEELNARYPLLDGPGGTKIREITGEQFEEMFIIAKHILYERIAALARWEYLNNHFFLDGNIRPVALSEDSSLQDQIKDPGFLQSVLDMPSPAPPQASNVLVGGTAPHQRFLPRYQSSYAAEDSGAPSSFAAALAAFDPSATGYPPGHPHAPGSSQPLPQQTGYLGAPPPPVAPQGQSSSGHQYAPGPPQTPPLPKIPFRPGSLFKPLPPTTPRSAKKRRERSSEQSAASLSVGAPVNNSSDAAPAKKTRTRPLKRIAESLSSDAPADNSSDGYRAAKRSKTQHGQELGAGTVADPIVVGEVTSEGHEAAAAGVEDTVMKDAEKGNDDGGEIGEQS